MGFDRRSYDDGGRLTQQTFGNGIVEDFGYVTNDNLPSTRETGVGDFSFTWDENKNKTSESVTGAMSGYDWSTGMNGFDDGDRLVTRNQGSGGTQLNESSDLSPVGDMESTTTNGTTTNRTHGNAHELTAIAATSIASDLKGNILNDAEGRTFQWDWNNQMKSVDLNADTTPDVTFTFDALRRRTSKTIQGLTTVFASFGSEAIADYTGSGVPTAPLRLHISNGMTDEHVLTVDLTDAGSFIAGTPELLYHHYDANWHTRGITDANGIIRELYAYSSYGIPTFLNSAGAILTHMGSPAIDSPLGNRFLFTGREFDAELQLYHFRYRSYSPRIARFVNRDPIHYYDGPSVYASYYVPSASDPFGLAQTMKRCKCYHDPCTPGNGPCQDSYIFVPVGENCQKACCPTGDVGFAGCCKGKALDSPEQQKWDERQCMLKWLSSLARFRIRNQCDGCFSHVFPGMLPITGPGDLPGETLPPANVVKPICDGIARVCNDWPTTDFWNVDIGAPVLDGGGMAQNVPFWPGMRIDNAQWDNTDLSACTSCVHESFHQFGHSWMGTGLWGHETRGPNTGAHTGDMPPGWTVENGFGSMWGWAASWRWGDNPSLMDFVAKRCKEKFTDNPIDSPKEYPYAPH